MRLFWKKLTACAVCAALLLTSGASLTFAADDYIAGETTDTDGSYKAEIDDLNSHINALKEEQKKLDAEISKTKNDKAALQKQREQLQNQIYLAQQQIDLLGQRIASMQNTIEEEQDNIEVQQDTIEQKQSEISKNYDLYKTRLRKMYMRDNATSLGVVLGADSYSDMLAGAEMTKRISVSDQEFIDSLVKTKHEMEAAKAEMEAALAKVEAAKAQVEEDKRDIAVQQQSLSAQKEVVAKQEEDIAQLQKEFEAQKAQKQKEEKEAQAEIDRIYRENASSGDYVGGDFKWPVSGYTKITSAFGWRFGGSDYHTGVDIAGRNSAGQAIFQQPIRAANDGVVIYASNSYTPGKSYGKYIIVDHGGGMSTLYGHADSVIVQKGQQVTQGQALGYVGTTGWSTGPHLHFEIRVDGTPKNPMSYFS